VPFSPSSKNRLTNRDLKQFRGDTLFDRVARAVSGAGVLPRKELYEAWEVARRVRRRFRGGRVVDVAGGHGLLAHLMLLLDDTSASAYVVDPRSPPSASAVAEVLSAAWPRLAGRVNPETVSLDDFAFGAGDLVVSSHACGSLTDRVLACAVKVGARVAVLPCCHDVGACDVGPLAGWVDASLAIDLRRALRLEAEGYRVWTQAIPAAITPKNRLLLGAPVDRSPLA
jgi:hypothetical protein